MPFTLPPLLSRLTVKFVVEVAFSVLVTLVATKIATGLLASPPESKATARVEAPAPVAHPLQLPEKPDTELSPAMSRFMEKAALAHVSNPRAEPAPRVEPARIEPRKTDEIVPAAEPPVSAAPAVWAATQRAPRPPVSRSLEREHAPERSRSSVLAAAAAVIQAAPPTPRPRGVGENGPAVIPAPAAASALDTKVGAVPRPKADIPKAGVPDPLAPAAVALVEPAPPSKPTKNIVTRIGDAIPSPRGIVEGVGNTGKAIGDTIGSLFKF